MTRRQVGRAQWSPRKLLVLLAAAAGGLVLLVVGVVLAVVSHSEGGRGADSADGWATVVPSRAPAEDTSGRSASEMQDSLAARPMPSVPVAASRPGPVSQRDPGAPILLPAPTRLGPAGVPTGFPHTPEGALAQLAAIDQAAMQSGSMDGARAVITEWAMPGGPTTTSWSGVAAMNMLLTGAGLSGGGSPELAIVFTPLMGLIKGVIGSDFVIPCVDFELDVTLQQTARGGIADCQRMVWRIDRWLMGPGAEPAVPPSVWPGTDLAISVGYRDLRRE